MRKLPWHTLLLAVFLLAAAGFYLLGVQNVPFHPDESTQLFMSSDLETFFRDPAALFWKAGSQGDLRQHYRELDAPLARYLIGLGRVISGQPNLQSDWNWSLGWDENNARGALPSPGLLLAGRLAVSILFPFTLLLMYGTGQAIGGRWAGWLAMLQTASNALVLLHTRRAMSEGILVFATALSLWALVKAGHRPWLAAIPIALAINAKHLAALLVIPGLLAAAWLPGQRSKAPIRRIVISLLGFGLLVGMITLALNPYLWGNPLTAAAATWRSRAAFTADQVTTITTLGKSQALLTIPDRAMGTLIETFITLPATADTANYTEQIRAVSDAYLSNPLNTLFRGTAGGGLLMILTLFGLILAVLNVFRGSGQEQRRLVLLLVATLAQVAALVLLVPVPFQRYYLVLVPYSVLWFSYGLARVLVTVTRRLK